MDKIFPTEITDGVPTGTSRILFDDGTQAKDCALSELPVSNNTQIELDTKVDKITGKGLSTEDYSTAEKTKLAGIEALAEVNPTSTDELSEGAINKYDQVVSLLAGAGISVTGTYPNFTVTNIGAGAVTSVNGQIGIVSLDSDDISEGTTNLYDQIVALTAGTNISITGTYPNFTINAIGMGFGDVVGPASAVNNNFASYNTTTGKLIKDSGFNSSSFAPALGPDDNYITDAEKVVIGNTSGVNTGDQIASTVQALKVAGATYGTVQDMQTIFHSSGLINGGMINNLTAGNISVNAGQCFLRSSSSETADLYFAPFTALGSTAITAGTTRYLGVSWNAGTPTVVIKTSDTWNYYDEFPLGNVTNDGGNLHINTDPFKVGDHAGLMIRRMMGTMGIERDGKTGGLVTTITGTRNIKNTAGAIFGTGLNRFPVAEIDTSITGTFDKYLGATFDASATQFDNLNYNLAGVKTALGASKWANFWIYRELDGNLVYLYGSTEYSNSATAQSGTAPTTIPQRIIDGGLLVARGTFQQGSSTALITSYLMDNPAGTPITAHTDLSNLSWSTSGHTDGVNSVATFGASGEATTTALSTLVQTTGNQTVGGVKTYSSTIVGDISGNAGSAATLTTARTINGVSFNGSANITVPSDIVPGTSGNVLTSNGTVWTSATPSVSGSSPIFTTNIDGQVFTGTIARFVSKGTQTIAGVKISLASLPTGANFTVDVRKNGTATTNSIFTSDTPISITTAQGATNGIYITTGTAIDNGSLVANDVLYFIITVVGSILPGSDCEIIAY